jgi:hypothetical protein
MTNRVTCTIVFTFILTALNSCGYLNSGTWENGPKNWNRIFGTEKPDYVKVKNSRYWKSAHWSYEYEYYLEISSCDTIRKEILSNSDLNLKEVNDTSALNNILTNDSKPSWFIPKPLKQYQIWMSSDEMIGFILLVDKETGNLFLFDQQF